MIHLRSQAGRINAEDLDTLLRIETFQPGRIEPDLDAAMPRWELDEQMIEPKAARRFSDVEGNALAGALDNGELRTGRPGKNTHCVHPGRSLRTQRPTV